MLDMTPNVLSLRYLPWCLVYSKSSKEITVSCVPAEVAPPDASLLTSLLTLLSPWMNFRVPMHELVSDKPGSIKQISKAQSSSAIFSVIVFVEDEKS